MKTAKGLVVWIVVILVVVLGGMWLVRANSGPKNLGPFAACLKDKGALFYGAFWCPVCQKQKKMFGNAAGSLPYVECSTADGRSQLPLCEEKKIASYPTWDFADGSRENGLIPLERLAEKTSCELPSP